MRTSFSCAQRTTGACAARVTSAMSRTPISSKSPSDAVIPTKSWYGNVIISKRRASARKVGLYSVSREKSSVPSNAIQLVIAGSSIATSSLRTYTNPDPHGDSSHFCPPQARMSTGVSWRSSTEFPTP